MFLEHAVEVLGVFEAEEVGGKLAVAPQSQASVSLRMMGISSESVVEGKTVTPLRDEKGRNGRGGLMLK